MHAGNLRSLVSVQQRTATLDSYGQQSTTWTEVKKVYAHISGLTGRELVLAQAVNTEVSHEITVRWDAALWADPKTAAAYRIVLGSRVFDIHGVVNVDERNRMVVLQAAEGLNQG